MIDINKPSADKYREWVRMARNNGIDWRKIYYANGESETYLIQFLETQKMNNFWAIDLTPEDWYKIVDSEKESEEESVNLEIMNRSAELVDISQDNKVNVPTVPQSSWQLYKQNLLDNGFNKNAVEDIEKASISILKKLNNNTVETGPVKGLVVGNVQSGKTANMAGLMAMAADWGWNFFVVLSGTVENLRKQTQSRLNRDLNRPGNVNWLPLEHLSKHTETGKRAQDLHFEDSRRNAYFNVCLKNSTRLKNLIEWMQKDENKYQQMKVLVIDDEADQASINTADINSDERARINSLIVNLVEGNKPNGRAVNSKVMSMNYISYTATPYANFLNESTPESLYPKNFIKTLNTSNEYFGPKEIFGLEGVEGYDGLNIVRTINEEDEDQIKMLHEGETDSLPESMKNSICWFLCSTASMKLNGYKKPISMMVHTSQKQNHHRQVAGAIKNWLYTEDKEKILNKCKSVWLKETSEFTIETFRESYKNYGKTDDKIIQYPKFREIEGIILTLIKEVTHIPLDEDEELDYHENIHLCVDNCANNGINDENMHVRLAYPTSEKNKELDHATAFIIVGGTTLSRGLTIEGLVSTYFRRTTQQADSLMQMGRWFGYRPSYELFPRIWMTDDTIEKFTFLSTLEYELREDLYQFSLAGADPSVYGPRVKNTPKVSWMRVTARNRMQMAREIEIDFTGTSAQTIVFENNPAVLQKNINVTEAFLNVLGVAEVSDLNNSFIFRNIDFNIIKESLLDKFILEYGPSVFNNVEAFGEWINQVTKTGKMNKWNVIVAGTGTVNDEKNEWNLPFGSVGVVNRSRKNIKKKDQNIINIGVLRAPKDLLADVKEKDLPEDLKGVYKNSKIDPSEIRSKAGLANTPQLLIYRIDKNSKAMKNTKLREDLNACEDIIGLCLTIPGIRSANNLYGALQVKIVDNGRQEWSHDE
ncbi:Z1 domain-containing protein [Evansella sp. LMS18]|uniref:Z1 domain-containing protein n=1 Tax=Evansella sp. LMS18 TaxID=2924033 RepID=UPI0020D193C7|nr:Z1 domain-containing protein [Evansella sp. LMS18]UTR10185.1 Z1 domain-containing protein [Evansella sp. LMS18]